jgi:hypothetical protein
MENLDIIILTSIVCTLFIVFGIVTFIELRKVGKDPTYGVSDTEISMRANMMKAVGSLFDNDNISVKDKKIIYGTIKQAICDMETDGVYFPETIKEELRKQRDELYCEYSGLPSVKSYNK